MRVGVLKPDHLGDLVLSAPAIAALQRRFSDLTLFCHPKNLPLAAHLFPQVRAFPMLLPHLDKDRGRDVGDRERLRLLREEVDFLICLRWDPNIAHLVNTPDLEVHAPALMGSERHVAAEQRDLILPLTGSYEIEESYTYPGCPRTGERPSHICSVGLCISAGFRLNAWPLSHWVGLAERLHDDGVCIVLIGGPAEAARLRIIGETLEASMGYYPETIVGSNDFGTTLRRLHELVDLVIATDSGTAHLAALVRPVLSLFGGSPWQIFAPIGKFNAILSRRYACSPCQQFSRGTANTCHTQECLTNLQPDQVYECLKAYLEDLDFGKGSCLDGVWMMQSPWLEAETQAA